MEVKTFQAQNLTLADVFNGYLKIFDSIQKYKMMAAETESENEKKEWAQLNMQMEYRWYLTEVPAMILCFLLHPKYVGICIPMLHGVREKIILQDDHIVKLLWFYTVKYVPGCVDVTKQNIMIEYDAWTQGRQGGLHLTSEDQKLSPIVFWRSLGNSSQFRYLPKLALFLFNIKSQSADCERLFSSCGSVATKERSEIDVATLGRLVQLKRQVLNEYSKVESGSSRSKLLELTEYKPTTTRALEIIKRAEQKHNEEARTRNEEERNRRASEGTEVSDSSKDSFEEIYSVFTKILELEQQEGDTQAEQSLTVPNRMTVPDMIKESREVEPLGEQEEIDEDSAIPEDSSVIEVDEEENPPHQDEFTVTKLPKEIEDHVPLRVSNMSKEEWEQEIKLYSAYNNFFKNTKSTPGKYYDLTNDTLDKLLNRENIRIIECQRAKATHYAEVGQHQEFDKAISPREPAHQKCYKLTAKRPNLEPSCVSEIHFDLNEFYFAWTSVMQARAEFERAEALNQEEELEPESEQDVPEEPYAEPSSDSSSESQNREHIDGFYRVPSDFSVSSSASPTSAGVTSVRPTSNYTGGFLSSSSTSQRPNPLAFNRYQASSSGVSLKEGTGANQGVIGNPSTAKRKHNLNTSELPTKEQRKNRRKNL